MSLTANQLTNKYFKSAAIIWLILNQFVEPAASVRIVDGQDIDISEAKFMVQLLIQGEKVCTGSLVSPLHVVTAAHCVWRAKPSHIKVTGGVTYLHQEGVHQTVRDVHVHMSPTFDIAVLKLNASLTGANIQPIRLCSDQWQEGDLVSVYGWQRTDSVNPRHWYYMTARHLQRADVPIERHANCCKRFPTENISEGYFCAGISAAKHSSCIDAGDPAIFKDSLCGVAACGGLSAHLGLFVDIIFVQTFLDDQMCKA